MADSSSFSSLFALVDNHLSRSNIQDDSQPSTSGLGSFKLPTLNVQRGLSDTGIPSTSGLSSSSMRFPLPSLSLSERPVNNVLSMQLGITLHSNESKDEEMTENPQISMSDCPINDVLAIQLSNMFKAREAKEQEEKRRQQQLAENLCPQPEESGCLIDLMPAVQLPGQVQHQFANTLSSGSSMESIVMPDTADLDEDDSAQPNSESLSRPVSPLKPITTDMSYILKHKIGKCSEFGKVLCARYRPVAAPYFREYVPLGNIKVFDFSTPSPDDIVMERLRKPSFYNCNYAVTAYE